MSQIGRQLKAHCINEEKLMMSLGMPEADLENIAREHHVTLEQYTRMNNDLMQGKETSRSVVLRLFKTWIVDHIVHHDLKIRAYTEEAPLD